MKLQGKNTGYFEEVSGKDFVMGHSKLQRKMHTNFAS